MLPFLHPGRDYVRLCPCNGIALVPGMVVLFRRGNGAYVLHRIIRCKSNELYLAGDAQSTLEGPVEKSRVLGWVSHVARNGAWHPLWRRTGLVYGVLWRWCFPLRRWWFVLTRGAAWTKGVWKRKCEQK